MKRSQSVSAHRLIEEIKYYAWDLCESAKQIIAIRKFESCDFVTASILLRSRSVCPDNISMITRYSSQGISLVGNFRFVLRLDMNDI